MPAVTLVLIKIQTKSETQGEGQCESVQRTSFFFLAFSSPQRQKRKLCQALSDLLLNFFYWYLFKYIQIKLSHQTQHSGHLKMDHHLR